MTEAWVQSLFDEEPEEYGPGPKQRAKAEAEMNRSRIGVRNEVRHAVGLSSLSPGGVSNPLGSPPLDWWNVSEEEVRRRLILAMCPERVCRTCGEPSRRIVDIRYDATDQSAWGNRPAERRPSISNQNAEPKAEANHPLQQRTQNAQGMTHGRAAKIVETLGFSDCGHDDWRPGVVLDPFA